VGHATQCSAEVPPVLPCALCLPFLEQHNFHFCSAVNAKVRSKTKLCYQMLILILHVQPAKECFSSPEHPLQYGHTSRQTLVGGLTVEPSLKHTNKTTAPQTSPPVAGVLSSHFGHRQMGMQINNSGSKINGKFLCLLLNQNSY